MASTSVRTHDNQSPARRRAPLVIAGGISGILGVVAYGSTQAPSLHDAIHAFPVTASQPVIVATFWIAALFSVFALVMVYALYRLLDGTDRTHCALLGFVDIGLDLAWDLFLVLWLVLTGVAMLGHRRFGPWWGLPAIIVGGVLFAVNAGTVPDPLATAGLFDPGPLVGLYAGAVSACLIVLGLHPRSDTAAARTTGDTTSWNIR